MYSLNKYLSVCYVPGTVQEAEDKAASKNKKQILPSQFTVLGKRLIKLIIQKV